MDEEDVVHLYNGTLLSRKENEMMPSAANWMDLDTILLGEINQRQIHYITYMWSLKN